MPHEEHEHAPCACGHTHHDHDHHHDHEHGIDCGCGCSHAHSISVGRIDLKIVATLLGANLLVTAAMVRFVFGWPVVYSDLVAATAAILLGLPLIVEAVRGLATGSSHADELVALAVGASFAMGEYIEAGAIAFFMLISSFIEHRTAEGARKTIESLIRLTPTRASKLTADGEVTVDARDLCTGDRVIVRPGDNIPGDGTIRKGSSTIDESNITGESVPAEKVEGDDVFGGTINHTGVLEVAITRAGKDTTLGQVQALILQAARSRPAGVRLIDQYAGWYTPTVLMLAVITLFLTRDVNRAISLLLLGCPCAFILSAPTAMVAALSAAARLGILVKNVADLEVARNLTAVVFDKTGTLTLGQLVVARLFPSGGVDPVDLLRVCASAEQGSKHPVAKAILETARKANIEPLAVTHSEELAGRGMRAILNGSTILVGRQTWLWEHGVVFEGIDISSAEGLSLLFVAQDGRLLGGIGLEDRARSGARHVLAKLASLGLKRLAMVTGDRRSPAERVARELGGLEVHAETLPAQKVDVVEDFKKQGHTVLVVGDGVNDGPALAAGNISVAMGAAGSDVAIHSASIALMNNHLNRIPFLIELSRRTVSVIRQNLFGVLLYIVAMLVLLTLGWITPMVAAIGHGLSSIIVVFSSARLVRAGEALQEAEERSARAVSAPRLRVVSAASAAA